MKQKKSFLCRHNRCLNTAKARKVKAAIREELEKRGESIDFDVDSFKNNYGHCVGNTLRHAPELRIIGDCALSRILSYTCVRIRLQFFPTILPPPRARALARSPAASMSRFVMMWSRRHWRDSNIRSCNTKTQMALGRRKESIRRLISRDAIVFPRNITTWPSLRDGPIGSSLLHMEWREVHHRKEFTTRILCILSKESCRWV